MARRGLVLCAVLAAHVSGCDLLPSSGPRHFDITGGAAASLLSERDTVAFNYVLLDINRLVLDHVVDIGPGSFFRSFGKGRGPAPVIRVGVGDVVQVSVFEASSGGLFIPSEAGVRPGNFITLPAQEVDRAGNVTVPYAGQIPVLVERNASEVTVVGEVIAVANRFRIRPGGERVLDMISKAGGLKYPGYELFVTLQRATVYFPTLINNPDENIYVAPGDTIYVYREQQPGPTCAGGLWRALSDRTAMRIDLKEPRTRKRQLCGLNHLTTNPSHRARCLILLSVWQVMSR